MCAKLSIWRPEHHSLADKDHTILRNSKADILYGVSFLLGRITNQFGGAAVAGARCRGLWGVYCEVMLSLSSECVVKNACAVGRFGARYLGDVSCYMANA